MVEKINYIIPLGSQCFSAFFLKLNNLKLASFPFDWIFSSPIVIIDMLDDNFSKFLDKDNYVFNDINIKTNKHKIYLPELEMFNHRNPMKHEDYLYYLRCVNRFYSVIENNKKKLFLFTSLKNEIENELENICLLRNKLAKLTDNFILLCIFQKCTGEQSKEIIFHDNIILIQMYTLGDSDGVIFLNNEDNIFYKTIIDELFTFDLIPIKD
jgi:hypothetical protein